VDDRHIIFVFNFNPFFSFLLQDSPKNAAGFMAEGLLPGHIQKFSVLCAAVRGHRFILKISLKAPNKRNGIAS
jgi:hypothetical protein